MKKLFVVIAAMAVSFSLYADQNTFQSTLKKATVFMQGANLVHSAETLLKTGAQEIMIEGLSPVLDVSSLSVTADKGVLIASTEVVAGIYTDRKSEVLIEKMKDSLAGISSQVRALSNSITIAEQSLELLKEGVGSNMKNASGSSAAAAFNANLELYRTKAEALMSLISRDSEMLDKVRKEQKSLEERIKSAEDGAKRQCSNLKLSITSPAESEVSFEITYFTPRAGWEPTYEISVAKIDRPVSLQLKAAVRQTTGMDWNGIMLSLSSGAPSRTNSAPEFSTWYLWTNSMTKARTVSLNTFAAMPGNALRDNAIATEESITMDDYVAYTESDVNDFYDIALPYDIQGDGTKKTIDLKQYDVNAEYYYYAAPKLSDEVYLMAEISDWQKLSLLPGAATVTYGGSFIGNTFINPATVDDVLKLTLGTDNRIVVKREISENLKKNATVGINVVENKGYRITVRNGRNNGVNLKLEEQYPVSTDTQVEVKLTTAAPSPTKNDPEHGLITWQRSIEPGETCEFEIGYSVKYPKEKRPSNM